ncbi:MAG: pseudouridine synthase [Gemmatimonadaceae bacterium]|nr:pseudouridine synthase [Gemmatimonadaceae bacterium]
MPAAPPKLAKYLANLGYGTRRAVEQLLADGRVTTADGRVLRHGDTAPHDTLRVDGEPLDPAPGRVVMLHKPAGYVSSTRDVGALVYELLPPRFLQRDPVMATVGRLDRDTTGLLLLTDDGPLNHRLTSPRHHWPKRYRASLAEPLRGDEAAQFASGTFRLEGEPSPLAPATLEVLSPREVWVTLTEGRYHQVRRMFAACGNHVVALHREAIGPVTLGELPLGQWRLLTDAELSALRATP